MVLLFSRIIWRIDLMIIWACNSLYWGDALILSAAPSDISLLAALTARNSVTANVLTGRLPMMVLTVCGLRAWRSGVAVLPLPLRSIAVILFEMALSFFQGRLL